MKTILISLFCILILNSCGVETNPTKETSCDFNNVLRTDVTGNTLGRGKNFDINEWTTFYKGKVVENKEMFNLQPAFPNPCNTYSSIVFDSKGNSRVKLFLDDSLMIDDYFIYGQYSFSLDLKHKEDGCYKLRAECYYNATESNNKADTILTLYGTLLIDKAGKYNFTF